MAHVRLFKHYVHLPYIYLGTTEACAIGASVYVADALLTGGEHLHSLWPSAVVFSAIMLLSMIAMGVYQSRLREGFAGMMLRTAVAYFLIAALGLAVIFYLLPVLSLGRGTLATSIVISFVFVTVLRWLSSHLFNDEDFKTRVLVLGTGQRALKIATRLRRRTDRRGFIIHGFVALPHTPDLVSDHGANILHIEESLLAYCQRNDVREIVIAVDERRARDGGSSP